MCKTRTFAKVEYFGTFLGQRWLYYGPEEERDAPKKIGQIEYLNILTMMTPSPHLCEILSFSFDLRRDQFRLDVSIDSRSLSGCNNVERICVLQIYDLLLVWLTGSGHNYSLTPPDALKLFAAFKFISFSLKSSSSARKWKFELQIRFDLKQFYRIHKSCTILNDLILNPVST